MPRPADDPAPQPILKWAGGKKQLLPAILPRLPARIRTYYEPFVGGGAVFFALAAERRFERAVLSDRNAELVNLYRVVRDELDALCAALEPHQARATDATWFYAVRGWLPEELDPVEQAARMLFLNKTCFNGLYRVNRQGRFNAPFGRYERPRVLDRARLEAAHRALQGVDLRCADFADVALEAGREDAVYFDPPYAPVSRTASFESYQPGGFGAEAQARLVDVYRRCWSRGATAVLSNSHTALTRDLYRALDVQIVRASRAINSNPSRRGPVEELLVVGPKATVQASRARVGDSALPPPRVAAS